MAVYSVMSLLTLVLAGLSKTITERKDSNRIGFGVVLILVLWTFIYAFRYNTGSDFFGYVKDYFRASSYSYKEYIEAYRDVGFYSMTWILNRIFKNDWLPYNIVLGILVYLPTLVLIYRKSDYTISAVLLYIFTMTYYSGFNGVRQGIAVGFVFYAYYMYFERRKYFKYFLIILLAFTFHSTALVVIPFHFLSRMRVKSANYIVFVGVMVVSYFALFDLWSNVISLLEALGQDKLVNDYSDITNDRGSSFLRFAVAILPVIIAYFSYRKLKIYDRFDTLDRDILLCTFAGLFSLFSMKYWGFSRIGLYFASSQVLLIPRFSELFGNKGSKMVVLILILILYFLYMYSLIMHGEGALDPYTFIFGHNLTGNWNDYL